MKVNEVFYSLQGEGRRAGEASVFVRLAGCDLSCSFCDTEFESGKEMSIQELDREIFRVKALAGAEGTFGGWIVWTGGEPTLQLSASIVQWFKDRGWKQAIETNGAHPVPPGLDWVCVSPKVAEHVLVKNFPEGVDELRYPVHAGRMAVPEVRVKYHYKYLSPIFDGERLNPQNVRRAVELCLQNPDWRLSLQLHKLMRVL